MLDHLARAALSRRQAVTGAGGLAALLAAGPRAAAADTAVDFSDPIFNVRAFTKISATLEAGKTGYVHYSGKAFGLNAEGVVTPFYGIEGLGCLRALPQGGGAMRFLFAECAIYTSLKTGQPLETWTNPWTDETLSVWHQRNGPVNYEISPGPSTKLGAFDKSEGASPAFRLPWLIDGDRAMFALDVASKRPNPLDPRLYPRESAGTVLHISEHSQYLVSVAEISDPSIPSVNFFGALQSLKPWHPWMLMGQRPGKVFTRMVARKVKGPDGLPPAVLAYAEKNLAAYLKAPETWTGQYVTAYDLYKSEFPRAP
jgi:hypothetical protein